MLRGPLHAAGSWRVLREALGVAQALAGTPGPNLRLAVLPQRGERSGWKRQRVVVALEVEQLLALEILQRAAGDFDCGLAVEERASTG